VTISKNLYQDGLNDTNRYTSIEPIYQ